MEELKPILIKPMVVEYYNMLITDEQRQSFFKELVMCGLAGTEPTTEDPLLKLALKPCLDSIRECRENYNRRQAKNAEYGILGKEYGAQGKEYGILGKEYGILGGRPRKRPDVYEKIYSFILSDENYLKSALSEDKTQNRMLRKNIKARIPEVAENNDENNKLINGVIKKIKEENANNNNGEKGKEFGIQGGRPRKGESPEDYIIRKKGDCEWTRAFKEIKQDQELIEKIKTNSVITETIEELSKEYSKDTIIDVMRWIKEKN